MSETVIDLTNSDDEDDYRSSALASALPAANLIMDMFPDADAGHVQSLLRKFSNSIDMVVKDLQEGCYPIAARKDATETGYMYDYKSTDAFTPSPQYLSEAKEQLKHDFKFLTKRACENLMEKCHNRYFVSYNKVLECLSFMPPDKTVTDATINSIQKCLCTGKIPNIAQRRKLLLLKLGPGAVMQHPAVRRKEVNVSDAVLEDEIRYTKEFLDKCFAELYNKAEVAQYQPQPGPSLEDNECGCCFGSYAIENMVACHDEGHLFCKDCLKSYADTQIFSNASFGTDKESKKPIFELTCMHSNGCVSKFDQSTLESCLPEKTLIKYAELQSELCLQIAGLQNLFSCNKCRFKIVLELEAQYFECPECKSATCRLCEKEAHGERKCNETEEEFGRHTVEEAMSNSIMRRCPKCSKPYLKSDGCNKIRCGCGCLSCYICNIQIESYTHFCQLPHCDHSGCKKCALWDKVTPDADNEVRARQAALNAAAELERKKVKVDVRDLLNQSPTKKLRRR